ncbi:MAG: hypothetical protein AAF614_06360 [Chloroflexota bacterium]
MDTYFDLGTYSRVITTDSKEAQVWFDRGLNWTYGFNHGEAVACFRKSANADPTCAMAQWGIALASGPYINKQWSYYSEKELARTLAVAFETSRQAADLMANCTEIEKALIEAQLIRYQSPDVQELPTLEGWNNQYANAMRAVYRQHPLDGDVIALFVESMMMRTPWRMWELTEGVPYEGADTVEMMQVLEDGMAQRERDGLPAHPGINHMYVHTMEMSPMPEKALRAADALSTLAPDGGHLMHMPSHVYVLCGHYFDALATSYKSVAADTKFREQRNLGKNDRYIAACCHDLQQMMAAGMMMGQYGPALHAARSIQALLTQDILSTEIPQLARTLDAYYAATTHVMVRFGMWEEIVAEPLPENPDVALMATAMARYARGISYAAMGDHDSAENERTLFYEAFNNVPSERYVFNNQVRTILGIAEAMLNGEVEYHRGNHEVAYEHLRLAVKRDDELAYTEPWAWMHPPRHALGALLLAQGHAEEAEAVYRNDLGLTNESIRPKQHPNNVWALHGLAECLKISGNSAELAIIEPQLTLAQARTDRPITSSCHCRIMPDCCCD